MHTFLLALHVLFAVFAVGPLVGAAMAVPRALRHGDAATIAWTARLLRIYTIASVLVVAVGIALMPTGRRHAHVGDVWIWVSVLLWVAIAVLVLAVLAPGLDAAARRVGSERAGIEPAGAQPVDTELSRIPSYGPMAALSGAVPLGFGVIVFLMVYQP
jgi:uncharacterized membrane protein